jgi:hypothetical protein
MGDVMGDESGEDRRDAGLSRRQFGRIGAVAALATAAVGTSALPAAAAVSESTLVEYGEVHIRGPQVVTREQDGQLLLVYVPEDRYVVLDEAGRKLWEALAAGTSSMSQLVAGHVTRYALPEGVAAFQVISFFDELRAQGYVTFSLKGEHTGAPLLDASLAISDNARRVLTLEEPDHGTTIREIHEMAEQAAGTAVRNVSRAIFATTDKYDLSAADLKTLLAGREPDGVKRGATIENPREDGTLGDLFTGRKVARQSRTIVIIIVTDDTIIIIVIDGGGGGPSSGKSRSACKTMCV